MKNINELPRKKLKELRQKKGWTQQELADKIGKQHAIISKYESGDVDMTVAVLGELAEVLGVKPGRFFQE